MRLAGFCAAGFFAASVLMACSNDGSGQANPAPSVKTLPTPAAGLSPTTEPTFSYADGAGNSYQIDGSSLNLVYSPVRANESSSGNYNGGVGWSKVLSQGQYEALAATFGEAIAATDQQTTVRSKGTGVVEFDSRQAILTMSSPIRQKLEAELQALGSSV